MAVMQLEFVTHYGGRRDIQWAIWKQIQTLPTEKFQPIPFLDHVFLNHWQNKVIPFWPESQDMHHILQMLI